MYILQNLILEHQPVTISNLAATLLHIAEAQKIPKTLEEAIHSVSTLLTDLSNRTTISDTAMLICKHLIGTNGTLRPTISSLADSVTKVWQSSTSLSDTASKLLSESNSTT